MNNIVCFYGVGEYGKRYIDYCISQGFVSLHLTDPNRSLWWKQYRGMTIYDPNCIAWNMYDIVVITSDSKQYCEDATNQLITVHKVPKEKIKICQEIILLTKGLKEFYNWKNERFADIGRSEIIEQKELSSMLDITSKGDIANRIVFYGFGDYGKRFIDYCISQGFVNLHLTDPNRNLWWKQYRGMTIYDPNCIMWNMYDIVVITSDNKQYCEDATNQLITVH